MSEKKLLGYDIDGEEAVTNALMELLAQFPVEKALTFSNLGKSSGFSIYPVSGAAIVAEKENILGEVEQTCSYPFAIVCRSSPLTDNHKIRIKELLDSIGKWLEGQRVKVGNDETEITEYPKLSNGRRIVSIRRQSASYVDETNDSGAQDWIILMELNYNNRFERKF